MAPVEFVACKGMKTIKDIQQPKTHFLGSYFNFEINAEIRPRVHQDDGLQCSTGFDLILTAKNTRDTLNNFLDDLPVKAKYEVFILPESGEKMPFVDDTFRFSEERHRIFGMTWRDLERMEDCFPKENIKLELRILIEDEKLRTFEKSDLTDVILNCDSTQFHVTKNVLATYSAEFKEMFFDPNSDKANKDEIEIKSISSHTFQKFLEVLYGEPAINDENIREMLVLTGAFECTQAYRRCEQFLMNTSKKDNSEKFSLANGFQIEDVMKKCIKEAETLDDLKKLMPSDMNELYKPTRDLITQKYSELQNQEEWQREQRYNDRPPTWYVRLGNDRSYTGRIDRCFQHCGCRRYCHQHDYDEDEPRLGNLWYNYDY